MTRVPREQKTTVPQKPAKIVLSLSVLQMIDREMAATIESPHNWKGARNHDHEQ